MDIYIVEQITEADFGCEETDRKEPMALLKLKSEGDSSEKYVEVTEAVLSDQGISEGKKVVFTEDGIDTPLEPHTPVSMNCWGFSPDYFEYSEEAFRAFLSEHGQELKSESYIPSLVNKLITEGKATCKVLDTSAKWFGVTYAEDRPQVVMKINKLINEGVYPAKLF